MSLLNYESECPCGAKFKSAIRKPTFFTPSVTKINCPECGSRFFMTATRDKERLDRRIFITSFDEIEITEKALDAIRAKTGFKVKSALDKVGLLKEEPRSRIESDLDSKPDEA